MWRTSSGSVLSAFVLCVVLSSSTHAVAYRQTKTCLHPSERDPTIVSLIPDCVSGQQSWPVSWRGREIPFYIHEAGSDDIATGPTQKISDVMLDVTRSAIERWNGAECSDLRFVYTGLTETRGHQLDDGKNVIAWVGPGDMSSAAVAVTITTMTPRGQLVDTDVELNDQLIFTLDPDPSVAAHDVANTLAHEAGHMLGLDESPILDATMYFQAPAGESKKRDLHADDIAGVCSIYPAGVPERIYEDEVDTGGCCATIAGARRTSPLTPLIALVGIFLVGARRRQQRR